MEKLALNIGQELKIKDGVVIEGVYSDLGKIVSTLLPNIYIFAGIVLFFLILISGLGIILSASEGNTEENKKFKQVLFASIIGFLIIFLSYWIMQIVAKITGIDILGL